MAQNNKKKRKKAPRAAAQTGSKSSNEPQPTATKPRTAAPARKTYKTRQAEAKAKARRKTIAVVIAGVLIVGGALSLPFLLGGDEIGITDSTSWDLPALDGTLRAHLTAACSSPTMQGHQLC